MTVIPAGEIDNRISLVSKETYHIKIGNISRNKERNNLLD